MSFLYLLCEIGCLFGVGHFLGNNLGKAIFGGDPGRALGINGNGIYVVVRKPSAVCPIEKSILFHPKSAIFSTKPHLTFWARGCTGEISVGHSFLSGKQRPFTFFQAADALFGTKPQSVFCIYC